MQYSKIFSAVAIFVAAVAAAPACAPAVPAGPATPGVPTIPTLPGAPHGTPAHGADGATAPGASSGTCAQSSQYAYAWCCTDAVCQAFIGGLNVCPSIGGVASIATCCQNNNEQEVTQTGGNGLIVVQNVAVPVNALNCIV